MKPVMFTRRNIPQGDVCTEEKKTDKNYGQTAVTKIAALTYFHLYNLRLIVTVSIAQFLSTQDIID